MNNLKFNFSEIQFENELIKFENKSSIPESNSSKPTQTFLSFLDLVNSTDSNPSPLNVKKMTYWEPDLFPESQSLLPASNTTDPDINIFSNQGEIKSKVKRKLFSSIKDEEPSLFSDTNDFMSFIDKSDTNDFMDFIDEEEGIEGDSLIFKTLEKEKAFFTTKEPDEWFPLKMDENQKVAFALSETAGKVKKLIYVFRNKMDKTLLIGKTGQSFADRMGQYKQRFNTSDVKSKKEGDETEEIQEAKDFIAKVKKNPLNFEVGILYALRPEENLNDFETLFIDYKKTVYPLYNQRGGGGGGLARSEEKFTKYAIPKIGTAPFTPPKRYPLKEDKQGRIRPDFSPGFYKYLDRLSHSRIDPTQGFLYSIKDLTHQKEYCGATGQDDPSKRISQHCYKAEYFNPNHERKYNLQSKGGKLHPLMGKKPGNFGVNFLPVIYDISKIPEKELENYDIVNKLGEVEKLAIIFKKSLVSQGGLNCNKGNGGPIADPKKKSVVLQKDAKSIKGKKRKINDL